jgi:uncharacterized membrane protein YfhO
LQFRALYFHGWRATINHQSAGIEAGENGNIVLKVPAGDSDIELQFTDTRPRWMGKIISAIFVLLCLVLLWKRKSTNNREGFYRLKWFQRKTSEIR